MKKSLIGLILVAAVAWTALALAQTAPKSREAIRLSFAPIVKQAAPAVVNVFSRRVVRTSASPFADDPFFRRFFGDQFPLGVPRERVENSLGSGVILAAGSSSPTTTSSRTRRKCWWCSPTAASSRRTFSFPTSAPTSPC